MTTEKPQDSAAPTGAASELGAGLGAWLPIDTAPKDGTVIELLGANGKLDIGEWYEWSEHFDKTANGIAEDVTGEFSTEYGEGPHTHWRPMNAPNVGIQRASPASGEAPLECSVMHQLLSFP